MESFEHPKCPTGLPPEFTIRGRIRTKEKCPKCGKQFTETLPGIICSNCLTVPRKFFIDIYEKKFERKRIKIYSDSNGHPLDSFSRAQRILEYIRHEIDSHKFDPSKYIKCHLEHFYFSTQIEKWYQRKKKQCDKKKSLASSYVRSLKSYKFNYYEDFFGNSDVREIKAERIREFYDELPEHLTPKTQYNILTALQNFFTELEDNQIIEHKPNFKKILELIDVKEQEIRWFDQIEQKEILAYIEKISPHRDIVEFMCETGIRPGEAMALFPTDFDLKEYLLYIRRTFSDRKIKDTTKSGRITDKIPLSDLATEILMDLPRRTSTYLFVNPNTNTHYTLDTLDRLWNKVRSHFNIEKRVKLYNFVRHSFATQIARAGGTPHEIKEFLRHSDIRTSMKYTGKDMKALRARLKKRAKIIDIESRKKKSSKGPQAD